MNGAAFNRGLIIGLSLLIVVVCAVLLLSHRPSGLSGPRDAADTLPTGTEKAAVEASDNGPLRKSGNAPSNTNGTPATPGKPVSDLNH